MLISQIIPNLQNTRDTEDVPWEAGRASVAIIFRPDNHICMIRRAQKESDYWSGHMAFPGGREEVIDPNLQRTALRETEEEIGVTLTPTQMVGRLSDLRYPALSVSAFVYLAEDELSFTPDPTEVSSIHWLPFEAFLDPKLRTTKKHTYKERVLNMPIVHIGEADVWGISLYFIDDLIKRCKLSESEIHFGQDLRSIP